MGITLLKTICNVQPAYLDNVCLQPFMRMLVRMVREYMVPMNTYGVTGAVHIDPKEKMLAEIIGYCLEMLRPRINAVSAEVRLTAVKHIIIPLIDKNAVDKIVEVIIRVSRRVTLLLKPAKFRSPTSFSRHQSRRQIPSSSWRRAACSYCSVCSSRWRPDCTPTSS